MDAFPCFGKFQINNPRCEIYCCPFAFHCEDKWKEEWEEKKGHKENDSSESSS